MLVKSAFSMDFCVVRKMKIKILSLLWILALAGCTVEVPPAPTEPPVTTPEEPLLPEPTPEPVPEPTPEPVNNPPLAVISVDPVSGKAPLTVNFDAGASSDSDGQIVSYDWDFADGNSASGAQQNHVYTTPGSYQISLTVTDDDGATGLATAQIEVLPPNIAPVALFTADKTSGTAPLIVNFDASAASDADGFIVSYAWDFADGGTATSMQTSHSFNTPGSYAVTLTVTDNDGVSTTSAPLTMDVLAPTGPTAAFIYTPDAGTAPLPVSFDASSSQAGNSAIVSYAWDFADGGNGSGVTIGHTFTQLGVFNVTLTVTDANGLSDSVSHPVNVNLTTLSGNIVITDGSLVDSDVNDPVAPFAGNDTPDQAQSLPNPVVLAGFASAYGTGWLGDRFGTIGDVYDAYRVTLHAGQVVQLTISDFMADFPTLVDLDLRLYAVSDTGTPVATSEAGDSRIEAVTAPADGEYYVVVYAFSHYTNYVMTIGNNAAMAHAEAEFVPGEVLIEWDESAKVSSKAGSATGFDRLAALGFSDVRGGPDRPSLVRAGDAVQRNQFIRQKSSHPDQIDDNAPWGLGEGEARARHETRLLAKTLAREPGVKSAEPNYLHKISAVPNDSQYGKQWHYELINLPQAWDITTGDSNVIVAVIDTGVAMDHPDLAANLTNTGYDFISDPNNARDGNGIDANPDDAGDLGMPGGSQSTFHGTHVAGTIAAVSNNASGVAGIGWNVKVMPLRALGLYGGSSYDIVQAMRYAAGLSNDSGTVPAQRADIINMSLGGPGSSSATQATIDEIRALGVIVIAAAGNESTASYSYPASYNGVVSVSAVESNKQLSYYSNYGDRIDVAAPGGDMRYDRDGDGKGDGVLSTWTNDAGTGRSHTYEVMQGTSMAAPHMAGVVALMKSVYPAMTGADLDSLLSSGQITEDLAANGDAVRDNQFGYGLIDARKAVEAAYALGNGTPPPPTLVLSPAVFNAGIGISNFQILASKSGEGALSITNVASDAAWLSVGADSVDAEGFGTYAATIDRGTLLPGIYSATITFSLNDGASGLVSVNMQVADSAGFVNDAGLQWVLLLDPATHATLHYQSVTANNGAYYYEFTNLAPGSYLVVSGSDMDYDGYICDPGESCGGYPMMSGLSPVDVSAGARLDVNFSISHDVGSGALTILQQNEQPGFAREANGRRLAVQ